MNEADQKLFEKKHKFFQASFEKLSAQELIYFENKLKKYWHIKKQIFKHKNKIRKIELEIGLDDKYQKRLSIFFAFVLVAIFIISWYREDKNSELAYLFFTALFLFSSLMHHLSRLFKLANISNIELVISVFDADISDIDWANMCDETEIMEIFDEQREVSIQDEEILINKFNLEMKLAILNSMGYRSPTFW